MKRLIENKLGPTHMLNVRLNGELKNEIGAGFSVASVAVLNLDDIGDSAAAAAMAVLVMVPGLVVHFLRAFRNRSMLL